MADFRKYTRNDLNAWEAFLQKIDSRSLDQLLQEEKYARDNREELKRCLGEAAKTIHKFDFGENWRFYSNIRALIISLARCLSYNRYPV
ncbi:uncharacterized protein N7529_005644 [Penicillium soppii]|uniref:uncharacterized protein n=1 Tax=Penicillium soppii TaxID=69789 RepID=UPI002546E0C5|nr:uncharacterized protein N7529_005644 [Penicillium soppii]KAJ5863728.1 hypothetical protein N7529_005644 [Penicillium soppii]